MGKFWEALSDWYQESFGLLTARRTLIKTRKIEMSAKCEGQLEPDVVEVRFTNSGIWKVFPTEVNRIDLENGIVVRREGVKTEEGLTWRLKDINKYFRQVTRNRRLGKWKDIV